MNESYFSTQVLFFLAWSNCTIRVNGPESGRPMIIINDAHKMGVTAVAGTRDCKRIVSGGGDGEVGKELQNP